MGKNGSLVAVSSLETCMNPTYTTSCINNASGTDCITTVSGASLDIGTSSPSVIHSSDIIFGIAVIIFLMSLTFWNNILSTFFGGKNLTSTRL